MQRGRRVSTKPLLVFLLLVLVLEEVTGLLGEHLLLHRPAPKNLQPRVCFDTSSQRFYQADNDVEFQDQGQDEGLEEIEDDEAEDTRSQVDTDSDDYAQQSLLQIYARDRDWLAKATDIVLDYTHYPLGQLTPEDVEKIVVLMVSWVRQRSKKAALSVEKLLKRVVDDMRANNKEVQVNAKMYSLAMDAWAKSGAEGSWDRAQHIHDQLVMTYKETGDLTMRPTTSTYNILINAHGKRKGATGLDQAERVLQEMIDSGDNTTKPDCVTINTLLDGYAKSRDKRKACQRAPELVELMKELDVPRSPYTYTVLQEVFGKSNLPDGPEKSLEVLQTMLSKYKDGSLLSKPACINYNNVLGSLSRTQNRTSAVMATKILDGMEKPVSEGGFDVEPDRMTYALAILTCVRCSQEGEAEKLLLRMEERAREDEQKRRAVSSAAPASVVLDLECFNVVVTALAKRRAPGAVERIIAILGRMKQYAEGGQPHVMPTVRSWNALLNALSRSRDKNAGERAEQVLRHMLEKGKQKVKPNAFSFTAVLAAYQNSRNPDDARRADDLLREMESLYYEKGELDSPPDVYHYTIVCNAWSRSGLPTAPTRVMQIIAHMNELAEQSPNARPNARTYHALVDCVAKHGPKGEAERLLDHLMMLEHRGEKCLDAFCFNSVIDTICREKAQGDGRRAEAVLDKMLEHGQFNPSCKPTTRTFTKIIYHYRKSRAPDAPYRAEYLLNRMIALFKEGHRELEPDKMAFGVVIDTYCGARHPDAGTTAERLLKQMKDLRANDGATKLVIDTSVIYNVLFAWSISGDEDAGRRAELHLDFMERRFDAGGYDLKPDRRSYGIVLNAWSKSSTFDKARRALNVVGRMEAQERKGNNDLHPNEHCLSLVINACAFTNSGPESEAEAFEIAVSIFDRMLASEDCKPSSLTYGWFMQACGRLKAPEHQKEAQIERAWVHCCEQGLVNAFVLHRLTGAAPDPLYKKLMKPVLEKSRCGYGTKEQLKFMISPKDLPRDWARNVKRENERQPGADWWAR